MDGKQLEPKTGSLHVNFSCEEVLWGQEVLCCMRVLVQSVKKCLRASSGYREEDSKGLANAAQVSLAVRIPRAFVHSTVQAPNMATNFKHFVCGKWTLLGAPASNKGHRY